MATKGSSGSRRWIQRRPNDTRPILGMNDNERIPPWLRAIEDLATAACAAFMTLALALAAYAFGADWLAGHWRP